MPPIRYVLVLATVGCGSTPGTPAEAPPPVASSADAPVLATSVDAQPPPPGPSHVPTLASAGAKTCTMARTVDLGPRGGDVIVGFGASAGVAAWMQDGKTLAVRPIGLDGTTTGPAETVPIAEGIEPNQIYAVDQGFVILLLRWDYGRGRTRWWGLVVDGLGHAAGPPVDLGLDDLEVTAGRALDGERVGLSVGPAYIAKKKHEARWQLLEVGTDGTLTSTASTDAIDGISPTSPDDAVSFEIENGAQPIPRRADGTIYEPMGRPILVRTDAGGTAVGDELYLESQGDPMGAVAFNVLHYIVWSGTHFIYPFHDDDLASVTGYSWYLLPIDCRP